MDEIKRLVDKIRSNPEKFKDKNVIIGLGDDKEADILFMAGNPYILTQMLEVFVKDLQVREERMN